MTILGIETSCDDTCVAICQNGIILSNIISTQLEHEQYGGVLPEKASRLHLENIEQIYHKAISQANISKHDIDKIAYTSDPGLIGSLIVGIGFAKGLAYSLHIDAIPINHLKAHIYSCLIEHKNISFPFISLTVSGGHTTLSICNSIHDYKIIGKTRDDAAGEVLDKAGRMLGLSFPAGKTIDKLSEKGNANAFHFPKTKLEKLEFSFSGLKTSLLYFLEKKKKINKYFIQQNHHDICAAFQKAVINNLTEKVMQASQLHNIKTICINGGVSANSLLRKNMSKLSDIHKLKVYFPKMQYCTDNAAMVAHLCFLSMQKENASS